MKYKNAKVKRLEILSRMPKCLASPGITLKTNFCLADNSSSTLATSTIKVGMSSKGILAYSAKVGVSAKGILVYRLVDVQMTDEGMRCIGTYTRRICCIIVVIG